MYEPEASQVRPMSAISTPLVTLGLGWPYEIFDSDVQVATDDYRSHGVHGPASYTAANRRVCADDWEQVPDSPDTLTRCDTNLGYVLSTITAIHQAIQCNRRIVWDVLAGNLGILETSSPAGCYSLCPSVSGACWAGCGLT